MKTASVDELVKETGDMYEVLDALIVVYGLDKEQILQLQAERRVKRGGFEKRIKLISTD